MDTQIARVIEGKKFMWDGKIYESEDEAHRIAHEYRANNFEVEVLSEEGRYFVYTRRVVKEVVVEGPPPP